MCEHLDATLPHHDENSNHIRQIQRCHGCTAWRLVTFAFRLDADGNAAWGPPGEWWASEWRDDSYRG